MKRKQVTGSGTSEAKPTRSLPPGLAPLAAELELDQPLLVTIDQLEALRKQLNINSPAKRIAERLRGYGWLLPTRTPGVWEFAPAAHAGPIGHGHPFLELRAALTAHPHLEARVCLRSALWVYNLLDRTPHPPEIALPLSVRPPVTLTKTSRIVHFDAHLSPQTIRDVPVDRLATILMHLAARPTSVTSWGEIESALPELVASVDRDELERELILRPASARTRLAYLVQALDPQLSKDLHQPGHGKVWFGPRGPLRRHNQALEVADTILPFDPADLRPASG
jgi:hypothetical protein